MLCLPADAPLVKPFFEPGVSASCNEMVLLRPPVQSDWTRVQYYAKRVRRVALGELLWQLNDGTGIEVTFDTLDEVLQSCPSPAPFSPNLRAMNAFLKA